MTCCSSKKRQGRTPSWLPWLKWSKYSTYRHLVKCAKLVIVSSNRLQLNKHGDMYLLITMHESEPRQTVPSEMPAAASDQQYSPSGLSAAPSASHLSAPGTQPIPPRLTVANSQEPVPRRLSATTNHHLILTTALFIWLSAATHTQPHPSGMSTSSSQQPWSYGLSAAPPTPWWSGG